MSAILGPETKVGPESSSCVHSEWEVEVFFDGDCPLCKREIEMIRRRDVDHRSRSLSTSL